MKLNVEVLTCNERSGTSAKGKPWKFFVLNMVLTNPADNSRTSGEVVTDAEVKPGVYSCVVKFEGRQGRIEPRFSNFAAATR